MGNAHMDIDFRADLKGPGLMRESVFFETYFFPSENYNYWFVLQFISNNRAVLETNFVHRNFSK